jgi:tripartite-type tricarboxylate transporter receptor subunit TctC
MRLPRRRVLTSLAGAAALPFVPAIARAQAYPARPVRLIAPYPPGGVIDLYARLIGQVLSERLGQAFVVENRSGAGGNIGTEAAARAAPDGYTLVQISSANSWNVTLYDKLTFDFLRDIEPIASIYQAPAVLVVHPSLPVNSVPELIAYAKAHPGQINMGSGGVGSAQQVYGELFKMMAGIDMLHVPFRGGGPALTALLAGQVPLMFDTVATSIEHIRAGKLRALAVTSKTRMAVLPDVPPVHDFVPGFEGIGWQGLGAPRNTPRDVIMRLNKEVNAALADQRLTARIADLGGTVFVTSPDEFRAFIADYTEKWGKVIRFAGAKVDWISPIAEPMELSASGHQVPKL